MAMGVPGGFGLGGMAPQLIDWHDDFGARAFWFDAFVSHNRNDESPGLVSSLRENGVRVAIDHDGPQRGWPFPSFIFRQIMASRHLVLWVGPSFRLSDWIMAEIAGARRLMEDSGVNRIVIWAGAGGEVPAQLGSFPVFGAGHDDTVEPLVQFLLSENRVPAALLAARSAAKERTRMQDTGVGRRLSSRIGDRAAGPWTVAAKMLLDERSELGFSFPGNLPLAVVCGVEASGEAVPEEIGDESVAAMRQLLGSGRCNRDERALLFRLLLSAAAGDGRYWDDLLDCLAAENDKWVAAEVLMRLARLGGPDSRDARVAVAVLVCADTFWDLAPETRSHLAAGLPEVVRSLTASRGVPHVDVDMLSRGERLNLATLRLGEALVSGTHAGLWFHEVLATMGVSLASRYEPFDAEASGTEASAVMPATMFLAVLDCLICLSDRDDNGSPLSTLDLETSALPGMIAALRLPEVHDYARGVGERLASLFGRLRDRGLPATWFIDYSGLLRAVLDNWPRRVEMDSGRQAWQMHMLQERMDADRNETFSRDEDSAGEAEAT